MKGQLQLVKPGHGDPIDQTTQVMRIPGIDAYCPPGLGTDCKWPVCRCYWPERDKDSGGESVNREARGSFARPALSPPDLAPGGAATPAARPSRRTEGVRAPEAGAKQTYWSKRDKETE